MWVAAVEEGPAGGVEEEGAAARAGTTYNTKQQTHEHTHIQPLITAHCPPCLPTPQPDTPAMSDTDTNVPDLLELLEAAEKGAFEALKELPPLSTVGRVLPTPHFIAFA